MSRETTFLFDLDGTLIMDELLPLIGKTLNMYADLARLTDETMQGIIPFDESFRKRVDLLSDIPIADVEQIVNNAPVLAEVLKLIAEKQINAYVVTGNLNCWIDGWLTKHGLSGFSSTASVIDGKVKIDKILLKESVIENFSDQYCIAVGDGANDAGLFEKSSFGIACEIVHAVPEVLLEVSSCVIQSEKALCKVISRLS